MGRGVGCLVGRYGWGRPRRPLVVGIRRTSTAEAGPLPEAPRVSSSNEQGVKVGFSIPPYGYAIDVPDSRPGTDPGLGAYVTIE